MVRPLDVHDRNYLARPLNAILAAPSHIAILRVLQDTAAGATVREIARTAHVARQATMNALARLETVGVVRRQTAGRAYLFRLNPRHRLVRKGLLPLLAAEREFRVLVSEEIRRAVAPIVTAAAVFGSAARSEERIESDLDLLLIVKKEENKEGVRTIAGRLSQLLAEEFGLILSPLVFTIEEFRTASRKGESFFRTVAEEARSIFGPPLKEILRDEADQAHSRRTLKGAGLRRRRG